MESRGVKLKGYTKVSKEDKLDILGIIEAAPIKKSTAINLLGMSPTRYYRWQLKYYLDNCLDDQRGRHEQKRVSLADSYRKQIATIRQEGIYGKYVIGPETIMGRLEDEGIFLSHETIRKVLHQEGLIKPRPKVPRHEWKRFEAPNPNAMWQIDILYAFVLGFGYVYVFTVLDDYSRKVMHWEMFPFATSREAKEVVENAMAVNGVKPESLLTDRGIQFYTGEGKKLGKLETFLDEQEIKHILARVKHPQTLGKIERYHRTMRQLCLNLKDFSDLHELRRAIRIFVDEYNYRRKHKGIGRVTPQQKYMGEDKEIIKKRDELRQSIIDQRRKNAFSEDSIQKEVACQEVIALLKKAYTREVVLV